MRSSDLRAAAVVMALALLLAVTGCGADGGSEAGGLGVVRWRGRSDGADGMLTAPSCGPAVFPSTRPR